MKQRNRNKNAGDVLNIGSGIDVSTVVCFTFAVDKCRTCTKVDFNLSTREQATRLIHVFIDVLGSDMPVVFSPGDRDSTLDPDAIVYTSAQKVADILGIGPSEAVLMSANAEANAVFVTGGD